LSFEKAKEEVRKLGFKSSADYKKYLINNLKELDANNDFTHYQHLHTNI
jgi:hypothetical protein